MLSNFIVFKVLLKSLKSEIAIVFTPHSFIVFLRSRIVSNIMRELPFLIKNNKVIKLTIHFKNWFID